MKSKIIFLLLSSILLVSVSCSNKEEGENNKEVANQKSANVSSKDVYEEFLDKIENSIASYLPQDTGAFLLFLNTDGVAEKQRKYFEEKLPKEIHDMMKSPLSEVTDLLEDIGVLKGRSMQEVLGFESAHFVIKPKSEKAEPNQSSDQSDVKNDTQKDTVMSSKKSKAALGFILTLNEPDLHLKANDLVDALNKKGNNTKVIKEGKPAYIELVDTANPQLENFNFVGLKDSMVVMSSSKNVVEEIFNGERKLPGIFKEESFSDLAKDLPELYNSVIFAGVDGSLNEYLNSDEDLEIDAGTHPELAARLKKNQDLKNTNLLLAFNQAFADKAHISQFRLALSDEAQKVFTLKDESNPDAANASYVEKVSDNALLTLELPAVSTQLLLQNAGDQLTAIDPRFAEIVANTEGFYLSLNAVDKQKSFLPVPAVSIRLDVKEKKEEILKIIENLMHSLLESQGMIPPDSEWVSSGDNTQSILTAFGEEIVLASNDNQISFGTSRGNIEKLLGLKDNATEDAKEITLGNYIPQYGIKGSKELSMVFLNLKALYQSMEKVFAMGQAFGQKKTNDPDEFDFEAFGKALSTFGAIGSRVYIEDDSTLVISSQMKSL